MGAGADNPPEGELLAGALRMATRSAAGMVAALPMVMDRDQILQALQNPGRPTVSVEFFPPKDETAAAQMLRTAQTLKPLAIDFASITYGAGGTSRDTTLRYGGELVKLGFPLIGHLTCVGHARSELESIVEQYDAAGFSGILALRGDPPRGQSAFIAHPEGFEHAEGLVRMIREQTSNRFAVGVAGFPEGHPDAIDATSDIQFLARKVAAGADFVTTQLFLDNQDYLRFVEQARAAGVSVPILPGIMPVLSLKQARNFCGFCKARIPVELEAELLACGSDEEAQRRVGVRWAARQIEGLLAAGAPGFHLYLLNRVESALELLKGLGR
jgi:methylenetetrahydrofolate reductase (NADPH)